MAAPALAQQPAEAELKLAAEAIARRLYASWPPLSVAYPLLVSSVYDLLDQGVIEIGPKLHG